MSIKAVLFDLDGTLLPMDMELFIKAYFGGLAKHMAPHGYNPQKLIDAIWAGTAAMVKNNGEKTNEERFWDTFAAALGEQVRADEPLLDAFYQEKFDAVSASCGYDPRAAKVIQAVKAKGLRTCLATNPIFPPIATRKRIAWAGLAPEQFEFFTSYENSSFCKPNLKYYQSVLDRMGLDAKECLMVGNDVSEDMVAQSLGMQVFLLTDCLINKENVDISVYPHGGFDELIAHINAL
ncbi:MAG: HAD family hydrolase [Clostridia bacterium]|nr:HAD family hydrolase [Clostridia bacterium]